MKPILTLAALWLLCLCIAYGQPAIYIGGGPSIYSQTSPHTAGNLTVGVCTASTATCSLTSIEARGSTSNLAELVYSPQTGLKQRIATVNTSSIGAELFALCQAGASVTQSATAGIVGMGGGVLFRPTRYPNWSTAITVRAVYSPNNPGWQPWVGVHLGYTFRNAEITP